MDMDVEKEFEKEFEEQLYLENINVQQDVLLKQENRQLKDKIKLLQMKLAKQENTKKRQIDQENTNKDNKDKPGTSQQAEKEDTLSISKTGDTLKEESENIQENKRKRGTRAGTNKWYYQNRGNSDRSRGNRGRVAYGRGGRGRGGRGRGIRFFFDF